MSIAYHCSLEEFENAGSFLNQVLRLSRKDESGKNDIVLNQEHSSLYDEKKVEIDIRIFFDVR